MKTAIVLCCLLAVAMAAIDPEWEDFKIEFGRKYNNPTEEYFRKKIFLDNKMLIDQHNQRYAEGKSTFTMGINQFADLTTQEFASMTNGYKPSKDIPETNLAVPFNPPSMPMLNTVDWRGTGCVTNVKDQGTCGAGWAFSATGAIEFAYCHKGYDIISLSEQNLIDCTYNYGCYGCNGGTTNPAFSYVIQNGGIDTAASYPYQASGTSPNCRFNKFTVGATIYAYVNVPADEKSLLQAVDVSVVSATIDASRSSFQLYKSGTYYEPTCSSSNVSHGVLVVGYGTDASGDYWIVKNSYGSTKWGMSGYINMARNKSNNCGIATLASYPLS